MRDLLFLRVGKRKTGLKDVQYITLFGFAFIKKREWMALFNRAIRAICSRCSSKKERKDQFALLKRAKERFALFCQTMSDFHEKQRANSQPCFCVCHIIGFVAFCVCAVLWGLSLIVFVSPYGVYQLSLIGFVALQYLLLGLSLIGFVTLWG